ncbi:hypothetical protein H2248_002992 [Termitomyces sp. 'cryptogamus']|nr:hypothetical protein H2248_002992 [Termitomyces sp. 'cryptogamus']
MTRFSTMISSLLLTSGALELTTSTVMSTPVTNLIMSTMNPTTIATEPADK